MREDPPQLRAALFGVHYDRARDQSLLYNRVNDGTTYQLGWKWDQPDAGRPFIRCRVCDRVSWSAGDVEHKYCGSCNAFHDQLAARHFLHLSNHMSYLRSQR